MAKWRGFGLPEASPRVPDVNAGAVLDSPMSEFLTASPLAGWFRLLTAQAGRLSHPAQSYPQTLTLADVALPRIL